MYVVLMVSKPENDYATVDDLATFAHVQLETYDRPSPGAETLTKLFRIMYASSMATEEGQSITFDIIWIDPENPDPNPPERIVADRWTVVPFESRIPLTARALVKAAKATDARTSSFAVYATGNELLFMWGLVDQGNRAYDFRRYDSSSGPNEVGIFQSSAIGVGHLTISISCEPVAELRIDRLSIGGLDPLRAGPIFDALRSGYENYLSAIKAEIAPHIYEERSHWDASLRSQWLQAIARILLRIRDMRHGGALLITPDTSKAGLDVKYSVEYSRLRQALYRWAIATIEMTDASDVIFEAMDDDESMIEMAVYLEESVARTERVDVESEIDGTLWFIACLSRVDGLVLMGSDLSVYGFGTVINVEDPPTVLRAAKDNQGDPARLVPLSYDQFGTRHRSMMRYCNAYPGSVGFVVSQDGDIRGMTKVGDNLVIWDGVRLERILPSEASRRSRMMVGHLCPLSRSSASPSNAASAIP
jgi:Probable sensor domain DACNV